MHREKCMRFEDCKVCFVIVYLFALFVRVYAKIFIITKTLEKIKTFMTPMMMMP